MASVLLALGVGVSHGLVSCRKICELFISHEENSGELVLLAHLGIEGVLEDLAQGLGIGL